MSVARFTVLEAGRLTSIQAGPRTGRLRFGVPPSGPVDRIAFAAANLALGNPAEAAAIEFSLGGLTLRCDQGEAGIALTGGRFSGDGLPAWSVGRIAAGQTLRIRAGDAGNWGVLAFSGGIAAPQWLGSASTHLVSGLGGGLIEAGFSFSVAGGGGAGDLSPIPMPPPPDGLLRLVIGPQERFFEAAALATFLEAPLHATSAFDRTGMVLQGAIPKPASVAMVSEPAMRGAIQIDGSGRAVLLLADYQTTGGYPKLAVLLAADADRLAQARPGDAFRLRPVAAAEAVALAREERASANAYLASVAGGQGNIAARLWRANLVSGVEDAMGR